MTDRVTFVRALWGDSQIWRHDRSLHELRRALQWKHQPAPLVTYAFGRENAAHLESLGVKPVVLSKAPVMDFHGNGERKPTGYGGHNYGVSMWRHKLEAMKVALADHDAIVWLDLDCKLFEPVPADFWERMARGAEVQITVVQYHVRTCTWRPSEKRVVPEGAFIYCRDVSAVDAVIEMYKRWPNQIDQTLFARVIDERCDGWQGPDHYKARGYEPYCHAIRNQLFVPGVQLFGTIRGPKRKEHLPDDPEAWKEQKQRKKVMGR